MAQHETHDPNVRKAKVYDLNTTPEPYFITEHLVTLDHESKTIKLKTWGDFEIEVQVSTEEFDKIVADPTYPVKVYLT